MGSRTVSSSRPSQRVRAKPVIQRDHGPNTKFSSRWRGESTLEMDNDAGDENSIG